MKKNILKTDIGMAFKKYKTIYIITFSLLLTGILTGAIFALSRPDNIDVTTKEYLENFMTSLTLQGVSKSEIFRLSFLNRVKAFIILTISGLSAWFLPLGALQLLISGFKLGFTFLYFIKIFYIKGFFIALILLIPHVFLFIPAICYFYINRIITLKKISLYKKNGFSNSIKLNIFKSFIVSFLIFWSIALFSCVIDGYIVTSVVKLVCSFFI